jgi:hypothetical protein
MEIEKKIQPDKFLPKHEADLELCAPTADEIKQDGFPSHANLFFWLSGSSSDGQYCLKFTEDECRRYAYLFEQAADRMAGRVVRQSDESYTVNIPD